MNNLDTGDILLFKKNHSSIISKITHSPYTHAAIVVKNPWWNNINKGLYAIQSSNGIYKYKDIEQHKYKSGVQIEYLNDIIKNRKVDVRHIVGINRNKLFKKKFKKIHDETYNKPYDNSYFDWICTGLYNLGCKCFYNHKHSDNFWCSALVAYFYTKMEWIDKNTDWSNISPADLSKINTIGKVTLGDPVPLNYNNKYTMV